MRARWNADAADRGILLLCHMDTVWDLGTLAQRPVRIADGKLYGPGAFDMKGGIVVALGAIRALSELGLMPIAPHHAADHLRRGERQRGVTRR